MTWQPIETAPKDGTEILLVEGSSRDIMTAMCVKGVWFASWCGDPISVLVNSHDPDRTRYDVATPTHWMPLPDPPTEPSSNP